MQRAADAALVGLQERNRNQANTQEYAWTAPQASQHRSGDAVRGSHEMRRTLSCQSVATSNSTRNAATLPRAQAVADNFGVLYISTGGKHRTPRVATKKYYPLVFLYGQTDR